MKARKKFNDRKHLTQNIIRRCDMNEISRHAHSGMSGFTLKALQGLNRCNIHMFRNLRSLQPFRFGFPTGSSLPHAGRRILHTSPCPARSGQVCCTVTAMSGGVFNEYGLPGRFIGGSLFLERIDEISEPLHGLSQYRSRTGYIPAHEAFALRPVHRTAVEPHSGFGQQARLQHVG